MNLDLIDLFVFEFTRESFWLLFSTQPTSILNKNNRKEARCISNLTIFQFSAQQLPLSHWGRLWLWLRSDVDCGLWVSCGLSGPPRPLVTRCHPSWADIGACHQVGGMKKQIWVTHSKKSTTSADESYSDLFISFIPRVINVRNYRWQSLNVPHCSPTPDSSKKQTQPVKLESDWWRKSADIIRAITETV